MEENTDAAVDSHTQLLKDWLEGRYFQCGYFDNQGKWKHYSEYVHPPWMCDGGPDMWEQCGHIKKPGLFPLWHKYPYVHWCELGGRSRTGKSLCGLLCEACAEKFRREFGQELAVTEQFFRLSQDVSEKYERWQANSEQEAVSLLNSFTRQYRLETGRAWRIRTLATLSMKLPRERVYRAIKVLRIGLWRVLLEEMRAYVAKHYPFARQAQAYTELYTSYAESVATLWATCDLPQYPLLAPIPGHSGGGERALLAYKRDELHCLPCNPLDILRWVTGWKTTDTMAMEYADKVFERYFTNYKDYIPEQYIQRNCPEVNTPRLLNWLELTGLDGFLFANYEFESIDWKRLSKVYSSGIDINVFRNIDRRTRVVLREDGLFGAPREREVAFLDYVVKENKPRRSPEFTTTDRKK